MNDMLFSAALTLMFALNGSGLPISMPPGTPDPKLDQMAPNQCLFFFCSSGAAKADAAGSNRTEQLIAEPQVQRFLRHFDQQLRSLGEELAKRDRDFELTHFMGDVVGVLASRPVAFYVERAGPVPQAFEIRAGGAVHLGPYGAAAARLVEEFPGEDDPLVLRGTTFQRSGQGRTEEVCYGVHGEYLLLAVGAGEMQRLLDRMDSPAPAWIKKLRSKYPLQRVSAIARLDFATLRERLTPLMPDGGRLLQELGFDNLETLEVAEGLDETGFARFASMDFSGPRTGLMKLSEGGMSIDQLRFLPANSLSATAVKLDTAELADVILRSTNAREEDLDGIASQIGFKIQQDLLKAFGDVWTVHCSPDHGGLLTGWVATASIRNRGKVQLALALQRAKQAADNPRRRGGRVLVAEHAGQQIFTVPRLLDLPIPVSYCVTEDRLVLAFSRSVLIDELDRVAAATDSLVDHPAVRSCWKEKQPAFFSYANSREMLKTIHPWVHTGLLFLQSQLQGEGLDVDLAALPSIAVLTKHADVSTCEIHSTPTSWRMEQHQVVPPGITCPWLLAIGFLWWA